MSTSVSTGTSNTVNFYRSENQLMNDSIDRIIVELHTYKKNYQNKSILLSGCGSKSGTTTIAINLAIALSMAGWKTLLVDCDLRKGIIYKKANEDITVGLADYLNLEVERYKVIHKTNHKLLDYIPSGMVPVSPIQSLCSNRMEQLVKETKMTYDYIIFDVPSLNIVPDANILFPIVDGISLVAALEQTTKKQLHDARKKVEKYKDKYYGLIINEVDLSQYKKHIKDYDYFKEKNLSKRYNQYLKKVKMNKEKAKEKKLEAQALALEQTAKIEGGTNE